MGFAGIASLGTRGAAPVARVSVHADCRRRAIRVRLVYEEERIQPGELVIVVPRSTVRRRTKKTAESIKVKASLRPSRRSLEPPEEAQPVTRTLDE